jgi:hypothetical protein
MNERRFDTLARGMAGPMRRRPLVGALAGAVLAAWVTPEHALACKHVGRKCDKNKDCCDGARCKGGKNGKCRCKSGFTKCGNDCANLDNNEDHCGGCNIACGPGETCCTFIGDTGPETECHDLSSQQTACGTSCDTVVNCRNFDPDRQCIDGECVLVV